MLLGVDVKQGGKVSQTQPPFMNYKGEGVCINRKQVLYALLVFTLNLNNSLKTLGCFFCTLNRSAMFLHQAFQRVI